MRSAVTRGIGDAHRRRRHYTAAITRRWRYRGNGAQARKWWTGVWICLAILPVPAQPHEWYAQPKIDMQTYYNDNLRLNAGRHSPVWGTIGDVSARLGVRSEVSGLSLRPRLRDYRYFGYSGVDRYNHLARIVSMNGFYRTETGSWNVDASYDRDSTLTSELLDSGRVNFNIPRETINVQPSWSFQWTPRLGVQLDGGYTRTSYSNGLVYGLHDYEVVDGSVRMEYGLTKRQSLTATVSGSRYMAPAYFDEKTDSYIVQAGWTSHWTERTVTSASGGLLINRSRLNLFGLPVTSTQQGYVVQARVRTSSERTTWSAQLSRNVDPTSFGVLMQRDQAQASVHRGLTPYLNGSVTGFWRHGKSLQNPLEAIDRTLDQVVVKVTWRYALDWALDGGYRWIRQDYGQGAAQSNELFVNLRYGGRKWFTSF